jgi:peptidoglycan/xylan/chitin deacetylase (PgdA/CDA1 family)
MVEQEFTTVLSMEVSCLSFLGECRLTIVTPDVAFTFDDGPYNYTSDLLDKLLAYNAKATFMVTGNNLGKGIYASHTHLARCL